MISVSRENKDIVTPQTVMEGAGVKLKRSIATASLDYVDPFLLFDHFGSENPDDYLAGFPMHPHRGIETVTYILAGAVNHRDSIGNAGKIGPGDVQWMTSGRGIMHEEMPEAVDGRLEGFQLWVNLPASLKMSEPRYQEILSDQIPEVSREDGTTIRVIAGEFEGVAGPVTEIAADPIYLDISLHAGASIIQPVERGHNVFAYLYEGEGIFGPAEGNRKETVTSPVMVLFEDGDQIEAHSHNGSMSFLLVSGKPLNEPIARYGPFVMNTMAEIKQTLQELSDGTFTRSR